MSNPIKNIGNKNNTQELPKIGDILIAMGEKWTVESIQGATGILLKPLSEKSEHSSYAIFGSWQTVLKKYTIIPKKENPNESEERVEP